MNDLYYILKFSDAPGKPARVQRKMGKLSKAAALIPVPTVESPSVKIGFTDSVKYRICLSNAHYVEIE